MPDLTWPQLRQLESFFAQSIRNHPQNPVVIAEGDSWFSFPIHASLLDHLDELAQRRMSLLRLESSGATILDMLDEGGLAFLKKLLRRYRPDVLLFSGGGNDIVGPELLDFIAPRVEPFDAVDALHTEALNARFAAIRRCYENLVAARREVARACIIVTHGYGNVVPSGRTAQMWGITVGPWIKPFLKERGYERPDEQRAIVDALMARFNSILDDLADPHFIKVDLRATISDDEWNDEIHPSRKGFEDAAREMHRKLQELLPDKFPEL